MQTTARTKPRTDVSADIEGRIAALDWADIETSLETRGCAMAGPLLTADECAALSQLYPSDEPFRSRIVMARHGFGRGEYKYFSYPLPEVIAGLRPALYGRLAPVANRWFAQMKMAGSFPDAHAAFLKRCHDAG